MFVDYNEAANNSWQAFERLVCRVLLTAGYEGARVVGQSGDKGADILATKYEKRWLFQVKCWNIPVGVSVIDRTMEAAVTYDAQIPVIVSLNGFDKTSRNHQQQLMSKGIPLQLWDVNDLQRIAETAIYDIPNKYKSRIYQEDAIQGILNAFYSKQNRAMVVLATGLGKTFVAAEAIHRLCATKKMRSLVLAHTNPLVYQLEREFWKFMTKEQKSIVWNGKEHPVVTQLETYDFVFACVDSVYSFLEKGNELSMFDIVVVDECHHCGASMYNEVFDATLSGKAEGSFLLGMTATPWRSDEIDIGRMFGDPIAIVDMVYGMKNGYLTNVDYRMYTDNIDWNGLNALSGKRFSPKQINHTLFINQWDDSVVNELQKTWEEQANPRAIVFCGTIEHADTMKNKLNALGFCNAGALYSSNDAGYSMTQFERNAVLSDFSDGRVNVICVVDVFNEGIDVPDVNIIVFQRVTHSRRIFIQQLGRGLRLAEGKDKVIVLDFVSDIRRFAAGIELKDELNGERYGSLRINLPSHNKVTFRKVNGEDNGTEEFLREWLDDITAIEEMGENSAELRYPPVELISKR